MEDKKALKQVATTSERLLEAMRRAGKKQTDLADETGLNKSTISRYVSGEVEPKQKAIMALARSLDVSEMWLWGYDVPMDRTTQSKKNDAIVDVVSKLRKDSDFFEVVSLLAELPPEQYASLKTILLALRQK